MIFVKFPAIFYNFEMILGSGVLPARRETPTSAFGPRSKLYWPRRSLVAQTSGSHLLCGIPSARKKTTVEKEKTTNSKKKGQHKLYWIH